MLSSAACLPILSLYVVSFFFFRDTSTTEIYTLSLHDALPICGALPDRGMEVIFREPRRRWHLLGRGSDRKSTRLNSSHRCISYAVFCLKKKKKTTKYSNMNN